MNVLFQAISVRTMGYFSFNFTCNQRNIQPEYQWTFNIQHSIMKDIIDLIYTQKNMLKAEQLVFNSFSFHVWLLFFSVDFFCCCCILISFWYCLATISRFSVSTTRANWVNKQNKIKSWVFISVCCSNNVLYVYFICYVDDVYSSISFNLHPFVDSSIIQFSFIREFCELCTIR